MLPSILRFAARVLFGVSVPHRLRRAAARQLIRSGETWPSEPSRPLLIAIDEHMRRRLELGPAQEENEPIRYREFGGIEHLERGLQVLRVWEQDTASGQLVPHVFHDAKLKLALRG